MGFQFKGAADRQFYPFVGRRFFDLILVRRLMLPLLGAMFVLLLFFC